MPTGLPIRRKTRIVSEWELVALISLLPCLACLLLAHAFPGIASAFAQLGHISVGQIS